VLPISNLEGLHLVGLVLGQNLSQEEMHVGGMAAAN